MAETIVIVVTIYFLVKAVLPLVAFKYLAERAYGDAPEDRRKEDFFWLVSQWDLSRSKRYNRREKEEADGQE